MTPAARLSAVIEILTEIAQSGRSADKALEAWVRQSRFAGSKDRASVSERLYLVLRNRTALAHAMASDAPRALVFGSLRLFDDMDADAIGALASGEGHAPAPLNDYEQGALKDATLPAASEKPWVRLNYPEWLHGEFERAFGPDLERQMEAMTGRAPLDLRVNTLKTNRETALPLLEAEGLAPVPTRCSPWGLRFSRHPRVASLESFKSGLIEVQDEGSQIACIVANASPGEQVVDLCAGGGGKTIALAAMMQNRGQIFAADINPSRLARIRPRAERAGLRNVQYRLLSLFEPDGEDATFADLEARCDLVFVDAPCSGSGAWRRQPDARWRLTPEELERFTSLQDEVLTRGARLVKPGGRLVYVTCSLLPSENEDRSAAFLKSHAGFRMEPWHTGWPADVPRPESRTIDLRLSPASSDTDGFYIARMRRLNGT